MTHDAGAKVSREYKIDLENFSGPMDLLLYLIRKEEVDIYDIPIGRILDQYLSYLEVLRAVDLDDAGDFLVMASTLMVIKSKMLLPVEEVDLAEELDPRYELVQQLLEYKNLKGRSRALEKRARLAALRVGRPETARPEDRVQEDRTLEELTVWDIFQHFQKVMSETRINVRNDRVIEGRQVPVREFASRVEVILGKGPVFLSDLLSPDRPRGELIGFFLAILLLVKTQAVFAVQSGDFGELKIYLRTADLDVAEQQIELDDDFKD